MDQHWGTWVTFKAGKQQDHDEGFIREEYAVGVYIDTHREVTINNNQDHDSLSIAIGDQITIPLFDVALGIVIAITLLSISTVVFKKKKP